MSESAIPTPIVLDTFTAADGADPMLRDLDIFPAGAGTNRWRWENEELFNVWQPGYPPYIATGETYRYFQQGRIRSGALTPTQPLTLTTGIFAPSTTMPAALSLKLRTDDVGELFSAPSVFLYLSGYEGSDRVGLATALDLIKLSLHDAAYDASIEIAFQVGGLVKIDVYDLDWSGVGSATVAGVKRVGAYVTSDEITLVANGAVVYTESPGIAFSGPWTGLDVSAQNPVVSDYLSEYQSNRIDAVGVYTNLTLAQAMKITEVGP